MEGYSVKIIEASKELTPLERVRLKDTSDCKQLDSIEPDQELIISVKSFAVLEIHNEKSDNKDYNNYIIESSDGEKYVTGSESFWTTFKDIYNELADVEGWGLKIYKMPSKNYNNKYFITCSAVEL